MFTRFMVAISVKLSLGAVVITLSGCLATVNLLNDGVLEAEDLKIARTMAEMTTRYCVTMQEANIGGKISGEMPIKKLPEIKTFFTGSDNWYKADILAGSVWTSTYYNKGTNRFACGKTWETFIESRTIQFTRKDVKDKSINDIPVKQPTNAKQIKSVENKIIEVKSLFDKNLITSQQYNEQVKRILSDQ